MIQHLLHSSVLAVLLYGIYYLFLRKETFFQWNRFYLLYIPLLSIGAPFLHILLPSKLTQALGNNLSFLSPVIINYTQYIDNETSRSFSLSFFVLIIYCLGVIVSTLLLVFKIININTYRCCY
jgi:bla regulator protein BlaR1